MSYAYSLTNWLTNAVEMCVQSTLLEKANEATPKVIAAMKQARLEVYQRYGANAVGAFTAAEFVHTEKKFMKSQTSEVRIRVKAGIESESLTGATPPTDCASWMDDHQARFGLSAIYGPAGLYYFDHLVGDEGIIGLPLVGTWQNQPGLRADNPEDQAYLDYRRENPWVNPNPTVMTPLYEAVGSDSTVQRFHQIASSMM